MLVIQASTLDANRLKLAAFRVEYRGIPVVPFVPLNLGVSLLI